MTLPYDTINNTGVLLPLFHEICEKGFSLGKNPTEKEKVNLLFRFIQYIERQIVLFDAIEDSEFATVNNMDGIGTLRSSTEAAFSQNKKEELQKHLKEFKVRIVLTAHPTQFYPGNVLGIITDLDKAIKDNNLLLIKNLLAQLGKTPFFKKQKPTPYDEAVILIWYLENVLYYSISKIYSYIQEHVYDGDILDNEIIDLGFWPGGDRDGNPFVTTDITLKVAERLRQTILKNYHKDVRQIKRRLTFKGIEEILSRIERRLNKHATKSYKVVNFSQKILLSQKQA
jgi:phosphoenolpyruvate carboxylase